VRRALRADDGVVSPIAAAAMVLVLSSAALAIDYGRTTDRFRDLQGVTDVAAMDAVRVLGDLYVPGSNASMLHDEAEALALQSAEENGFILDPSHPDYDTDSNQTLDLDVGLVDWATYEFTAYDDLPPGFDPEDLNAVRVATSSRTRSFFVPLPNDPTDFEVSSIAALEEKAALRIGSSLARYDSTDTALELIVEEVTGFHLGASAGYDALAAASVSLGDIWAELALGSSEEILNGSVTAADVVSATASALNQKGDPSSVAAAALLASGSSSMDSSATVTFGEMFGLSAGNPGSVADMEVNIADLLGLTAMVANGDNLLSVAIPIVVPGVSNVTMKMGVIEPPREAVGRVQFVNGEWVTRAETAQVKFEVDFTFVDGFTLAGNTFDVTVPIYFRVSSASADLIDMECQDPLEDTPVTIRATTSPVDAFVGKPSAPSQFTTEASGSVSYAVLFTNGSGTFMATAHSEYTIPSETTEDLVFIGPFDVPPTPETRPPQTVGEFYPNLDQLKADVEVELTAPFPLLDAVRQAAEDSLKALVETAITLTEDTVLPKILDSPLGIMLGGADVLNIRAGALPLDCHSRVLLGSALTQYP